MRSQIGGKEKEKRVSPTPGFVIIMGEKKSQKRKIDRQGPGE